MGREQEYVVEDQPTTYNRKAKKPIGFRTFLWNAEANECLGRNAKSWGGILLFYFIYYSCLGAFVAVCFVGMMSTLADEHPKWNMHDDSTNIISLPGMNCVPTLQADDHRLQKPLISYQLSDSSSYSSHVTAIDKVLDGYRDLADNNRVVTDCDGNAPQFCDLSMDHLGGFCNGSDPSYGYDSGNPCVLLRVNKVHGWKPSLDATNPSPLLIRNWAATSIPVTCEQEKKKDVSTLLDALELYPASGFPEMCFPFCGHVSRPSTHMPAVVMVRLVNVTRGEKVPVWCRFWDTGVGKEHHVRDKEAGVRFDMLIQD